MNPRLDRPVPIFNSLATIMFTYLPLGYQMPPSVRRTQGNSIL
jgi:hypothetical protein